MKYTDYGNLINIWQNHLQENEVPYMPQIPIIPFNNMSQNDEQKKNILFIGLNPSFKVSFVKTCLMKWNIDPESYFSWVNREKFDPEKDRVLWQKAKENYSYFKKFQVIADSLDMNWDHIDLFFWRATSQKEFKNRFLDGYSREKLNITEFGKDQLEVSFGLIDESHPDCIVIANALASKIYLQEQSHNIRQDPELGCYLELKNQKAIPLFPSSMLTGQRALDNYSFDRLTWHIKRSLKERRII